MKLRLGKPTIGILFVVFVAVMNAQNSKPFFFTWPGYVSAKGKWYNSSGKREDQLAYKHAVEIRCRAEIKECEEILTQIVGNEPDVNVQTYHIIEWNRNDIIAEDGSPICVTNRLLINFQEHTVTAMDMPKKGAKGMPLGDGHNACVWYRAQAYKLVQ